MTKRRLNVPQKMVLALACVEHKPQSRRGLKLMQRKVIRRKRRHIPRLHIIHRVALVAPRGQLLPELFEREQQPEHKLGILTRVITQRIVLAQPFMVVQACTFTVKDVKVEHIEHLHRQQE
eukprot:CAMPEP_0203777330 /NCGR_PEP_ID=MMETSP0099_2-20121227/7318_1 /ASSEMBLY_ACC=CAM_ASM_000209 /TAXON_ID=96639 /ORGANISM=" , Strain NY0313808BC1" /LENGTH=120 /DNA_ID=CAMNT_0050676589 /DNA_START=475 /DNA_END=840 /DNA_ORIENTATION=-